MNQILQRKGLAEAAEDWVQVADIKGTAGGGLAAQGAAFVARIPVQS